MSVRPYTVLSCAMSIDGYLDDATDRRLLLSNEEDFDRVDAVRAGCDAILVGAGTIRRDNPRLLVRSPERRAARLARGLTASPMKVTLTGRGDLDPTAQFFAAGDVEKIVFCPTPTVASTRKHLGEVATVLDAGEPIDLAEAMSMLASRGVRRLMVEGGGITHTQFLDAGLADELHLVIAPCLVGDPKAPRFAGDGQFAGHPGRRTDLVETPQAPALAEAPALVEVRRIGDVVLLRYALSERARRFQ